MAFRWYVLHVYSGFEKKVADSIREQSVKKGLEEDFEEILVPTEKVVEMRRGTKVNSERKFFPGYVLFENELDRCGLEYGEEYRQSDRLFRVWRQALAD